MRHVKCILQTVVLSAVVTFVFTACDIAIPDGVLACMKDRECPDGWTCHSNGRCYPDSGDSGIDSSTTCIDAGAPSVGTPCCHNAGRACSGSAELDVLVCVGGYWQYGTRCDDTTRCDTRDGATHGTCQPVAPMCLGRTPGDLICDAGERKRCGPALLTYEAEPCAEHSHCNEDGDARCLCDNGYTQNLDTGTCAKEECPSGYARTESGCEDIDECAQSNGGCIERACVNTKGGFECGECTSGFRAADDTECVDIDECLDVERCALHGSCQNTPGNYECQCDDGYRPENGTCVDESSVCEDNASKDCMGVCGGTAQVDECDVCGGDNASKDCMGVCGGTAQVDDCNVCEGGNASKDCLGVCSGPNYVDLCGTCDSNAASDCSGLVAHYAFDGNADDASGHSPNGIVSGATLTSDHNGTSNAAYYFGSDAASITVPRANFVADTTLTVTGWIYSTSTGARRAITCGDFSIIGINGYYIGMSISTPSTNTAMSANLATNTWYHFAGTYDGQDIRIYVNGELAGSVYHPGSIAHTDSNLIFSSPDEGWHGSLDDIQIWNRVLSATEINAIYTTGSP